MDTNALQLLSRFSVTPNSLGNCGKDTAPEKFKQCITKGNCNGVGEEVEKFTILYPYLKTISEIIKKPVFSYDVIKTYWIGSKLLEQAKPEHYDLLLDNLLKQGVPDFFIEELRGRRFKKFIPVHLFQVLYIGEEPDSGIAQSMDVVNKCMIRWGKVIKIEKGIVTAKLSSLKRENDAYSLTVLQEEIQYNSELIPELHIGTLVLAHWDMVTKILTQEEEKDLNYWTKKVLEIQ